MKNRYWKNTVHFVLSSIAMLFITSTCAHAYTLQGRHILDLMVKNLGTAGGLLVFQKMTHHSSNLTGGSTNFEETIKYIFPEKFRSDIVSDDIQRIQVVSGGTVFTIIDGEAASKTETIYDRYKDLLLYRSRLILQQRLPLLGVNVNISSLGRFQGHVSYVIGAQYPDELTPQVWVDKETFRPIRWIVRTGNSKDEEAVFEIRYLNWQRFDKSWYPRRIEFYENNKILREIEVKNIKINPIFSRDFFDIDHLKSVYSKVPAESEKTGSKEINEVRKIVDEFKKMYE